LQGTVAQIVKVLLGIALLFSIGTSVKALHASSQATQSSAALHADPAGRPIPDAKVVDQNGRPHRFYTDLVRGKVVAINFIYTTCSTICPPMGATFGKLQKTLGARMGKDVFLISISVDPATDTPERLRAWGAQFHAKPGWTLVTGDKTELDRLSNALGVDTASPASHSPMVLIVNDKAALWKRVYGLGSTATLTQNIQQMIDAPSGKGSSASAAEKRQ
jgi:protein SCO1/2